MTLKAQQTQKPGLSKREHKKKQAGHLTGLEFLVRVRNAET
jgi:hypothetical protein